MLLAVDSDSFVCSASFVKTWIAPLSKSIFVARHYRKLPAHPKHPQLKRLCDLCCRRVLFPDVWSDSVLAYTLRSNIRLEVHFCRKDIQYRNVSYYEVRSVSVVVETRRNRHTQASDVMGRAEVCNGIPPKRSHTPRVRTNPETLLPTPICLIPRACYPAWSRARKAHVRQSHCFLVISAHVHTVIARQCHDVGKMFGGTPDDTNINEHRSTSQRYSHRL